MNNIYYIYIHERLDTGQPFYVGKGKGYRSTSAGSRNKYWKNIVKKYGYRVKIIQSGLSETQALNAEKFIIPMLKTFYNLANFTNGGEGNTSKRTPETCKRISESKTGKKIPKLCGDLNGAKSEKSRQKRSASLKLYYANGGKNPMVGAKRSDLSLRNTRSKGTRWYNNGVKNGQFVEGTQPTDWTLGMIKGVSSQTI
jgi:hypothetical protein